MNVRKNVMTLMLTLLASALTLGGCGTWEGVGKDISRTGDAMTGKGTYATTVKATPEKVTAAAKKAVEQMKMTEVESSSTALAGKVTAKTLRGDGVRIDVEPEGDKSSKLTIYTHGEDAETVSKQIQDNVNSNLPWF